MQPVSGSGVSSLRHKQEISDRARRIVGFRSRDAVCSTAPLPVRNTLLLGLMRESEGAGCKVAGGTGSVAGNVKARSSG